MLKSKAPLRESRSLGVLQRRVAYLTMVSYYYPGCLNALRLLFLDWKLGAKPESIVLLPTDGTGCPTLNAAAESLVRAWAKQWGFEDDWAWEVMIHVLAAWERSDPNYEVLPGKPFMGEPRLAFPGGVALCRKSGSALFQEELDANNAMKDSTVSEVVAKPFSLLDSLLPQPYAKRLGVEYTDYNPLREGRSQAKSRILSEVRDFLNDSARYGAYCDEIEQLASERHPGGLPVKSKLVKHAEWTAHRHVGRLTYTRIENWERTAYPSNDNIDSTTIRKAVGALMKEIQLTPKRN